MKLLSNDISISANPYREWALILGFLFVLVIGLALADAQLFLSAVSQTNDAATQVSASGFDTTLLDKTVTARQALEKRFNAF